MCILLQNSIVYSPNKYTKFNAKKNVITVDLAYFPFKIWWKIQILVKIGTEDVKHKNNKGI